MGRMEDTSRKRAKRANLKSAILATVQTAGILSVALVAPNTFTMLKKFGMLPAPRANESIRSARNRLIKQGLLAVIDGRVRLTTKGERELRRIGMHAQNISKHRWDGKWRVLIFDIPDRRKGLRDVLRGTLRANGFQLLQSSVWVYPYNCEDLVALLKADLKIGTDMQYLIVDSIENDRELRSVFNLPPH